MRNVNIKQDGTKLVIEVDLSKELGRSASGKSITIASTDGNVTLQGPGDIKLGLNVYKK